MGKALLASEKKQTFNDIFNYIYGLFITQV